uniref:RabBD domain-containing protein n=1 Tax=Anopheles maculatus TaxID=74869 RepID=A0A182SKC4_9DIPT
MVARICDGTDKQGVNKVFTEVRIRSLTANPIAGGSDERDLKANEQTFHSSRHPGGELLSSDSKMDDMPDLSHLTQEERAIIEGVMMRQKQEEERENEIMRRKQDEVATLVDSIRQKSEQQKKAGVELEATCHICLKTKFADGIGHICHYCNIRCCAKCGGKVTLRNNKVTFSLLFGSGEV